jgi:hypothetical protein
MSHYFESVTPRDELVFEYLFLDNKWRSAALIVLTTSHSSGSAKVALEAVDLLGIAISLTFPQIIPSTKKRKNNHLHNHHKIK